MGRRNSPQALQLKPKDASSVQQIGLIIQLAEKREGRNTETRQGRDSGYFMIQKRKA